MMNRWRRHHYADTAMHKVWVLWYALKACKALLWRAIIHDLSKFSPVEVEGFERARPIFERAEYGTPEYQQALDALGPSLRHHYEVNLHHPEHYGNVARMSPLDQLEMLIDWKAATRRKGGDLSKAIATNADRFEMPSAMEEGFLSDAGEIGL